MSIGGSRLSKNCAFEDEQKVNFSHELMRHGIL
jgi:hypothetical protein